MTDFDAYNKTKQIAAVFATVPELREALSRALSFLSDWTGVQSAAIWELDRSTQELHVLFSSSLDASMARAAWLHCGVTEHSGIAGRVAFQRAHLVYGDYDPILTQGQVTTPYPTFKDGQPIRMLAAFPLVSNGALIGVLELLNHEPKHLSGTALDYLEHFTPHWGAAIESSRRREESSLEADIYRALHDARAISLEVAQQSGHTTPSTLAYLNNAAQSLARIYKADACYVLKTTRSVDTATPIAIVNLSGRNTPPSTPMQLTRDYFLRALFTNPHPTRFRDIFDDDEIVRRGMSPFKDSRSAYLFADCHAPSPTMVIPLISRSSDPLGLIILIRSPLQPTFSEVDERALHKTIETLTEHVAEREFNESALSISKIVRDSTPSGDVEQTLDQILAAMRAFADTEWAYVMERKISLQGEALECIAASGRPRTEIGELQLGTEASGDLPRGINARVALDRRAYICLDTSTDDKYSPVVSGPEELSLLSVPMILGSKDSPDLQVLGTLTLSSPRKAALSYTHAPLLSLVAEQLAYLIVTHRLYSSIVDSENKVQLMTYRENAYRLMLLFLHDLTKWLSTLRTELRSYAEVRSTPQELREYLEIQASYMASQEARLATVRQLAQTAGAPHRIPQDLRDLIRRAVYTVRALMEKKKQMNVIRAEIPPTEVLVDKVHAEMILENLLKNAWQSSYEAQRLWISVAIQGKRVGVTIRDEGPGFPPQILAGSYRTAAAPSKRGSGVGLWLTYALAKLNGGDITLQNTKTGAKGAEVTLWLPKA